MQAEEILILLRRIMRIINIDNKKFVKQYGVSSIQLMALRYLRSKPDFKATNRELKAYLSVNASTITGLVKRMEEKEWIYKTKDHKDRRRSFITLSAKGLETIRELPAPLESKLEKRLVELDVEGTQLIRRTFNYIHKLLQDEQQER